MSDKVNPVGVYPKYLVFKHPDFYPDVVAATAWEDEASSSVNLEQIEEFVFVLRPDRDYHARVALAAYMESVRGYDSSLAEDLDTVLTNVRYSTPDPGMIPT